MGYKQGQRRKIERAAEEAATKARRKAELRDRRENVDQDAVTAALDGRLDTAEADILDLDGRLDTAEATLLTKLQWAGVPASAAATGTAGQVAYESGWFYVCVATDTWQRVAIATWP